MTPTLLIAQSEATSRLITPSLVAAGFAGPATTAFTLKRKEESLEHGEIHEQEVISTRKNSRHGDNERKRHASKGYLVEQALRQKQGVRHIQKNNDMRREPADNLMREEQVGEQRAERVQQWQVREQVIEVCTANTHLASIFAA